ncbi:lipase [Mycena floridula]|nr:lipase [Mycena floridula]
MVSSALLLVFTTLLTASVVHTSPLVSLTAITTLPSSKTLQYNPYTSYASAAYCKPLTIAAWNCGANCRANPSFLPTASGGNGGTVQYWFVGWDPVLKTVVVSHQGTDPLKLASLVTDLELLLVELDSRLFPGVSSAVRVHEGFAAEQSQTATSILSAAKDAISKHSASSVTLVGHSLGAALSLLDAVYLSLHLPSSIKISVIGYGMPRVGNQAFADYIDSHIHSLTRINNKEDPIPVLPSRVLDYHHASGEIHIVDSGVWTVCPGQDNTDSRCSTGDDSALNILAGYIDDIAAGNIQGDHNGPYNGIRMGCGH